MKAYNFYIYGSKIMPFVPPLLGNLLCDLVGLIAYLLSAPRRQAVLCNLEHMFPDYTPAARRKIARRMFQTNMRNYYDLLRVHKIPTAKIDQMISVHNLEAVWELAEKHGSKGVIGISGHLGSFSMAIQASSSHNIDFYLLVEPTDPPELLDFVRKQRSLDARAFTITVGSQEMRQIFRAIKTPRTMICFALDRDVLDSGEYLNFCGTPAKLPTGAADFALRTNSITIPILVTHHKSRYRDAYKIEFFPERALLPVNTGNKAADIKLLAEQMLEEVERQIKSVPEEWVAMQPIWDDCK